MATATQWHGIGRRSGSVVVLDLVHKGDLSVAQRLTDEEQHAIRAVAAGAESEHLEAIVLEAIGRIHDLRHTVASRALAHGEGLPIISRLLGHRRVETTARYAHLPHDSVRESAERIAASIAADIL